MWVSVPDLLIFVGLGFLRIHFEGQYILLKSHQHVHRFFGSFTFLCAFDNDPAIYINVQIVLQSFLSLQLSKERGIIRSGHELGVINIHIIRTVELTGDVLVTAGDLHVALGIIEFVEFVHCSRSDRKQQSRPLLPE